MTLEERCSKRIFINNMRYAIYKGKEHDLYIALPDYEKLQKGFEIIFDKQGIDIPYVLFHKKRYDLVPPFITEENGYFCIKGKREGTKGLHNVPIHRLAYVAFYGVPLPGYHIHHIDGNKHNNSAANLVAVTEEEHCEIHKRNVRVPRNLFTNVKKQTLLDVLREDYSIQQKEFSTTDNIAEAQALSQLETSLIQPKLLQMLLDDFTEEKLSALITAVLNCKTSDKHTVIEVLCERYSKLM